MAFNKMEPRSKGRPKVEKKKPIKNPNYLEGWEWLFNTLPSQVSTKHKFQKRKQSIFNVLHYCKTCERVWELDKMSAQGGRVYSGLEHYDNFPSFGLPKKKCLSCKGGKNGSNIQDTNTKPNK